MKNFKQIISFAFVLCLVMASCKSDDDGTPSKTDKQIQTEKLTKTWGLGNVTLDGAPMEYTGFELTISANADGSNKTYSTSNGQAAWPASGTWDFVGENYNKILRSDGVEMTVSGLTDSALTLSFTITEETSAGRFGQRVKGVTGDYVFSLVAK